MDSFETLPLSEIWKIEDSNDLLVELGAYVADKCEYGDNADALTPQEKVLYICTDVEMEVNNGGFSQYFYNSGGRFHADAPAALRAAGLDSVAELMERANELIGCTLPEDLEERRDQLDGILGEELLEKLDALDNEFYELYDDEEDPESILCNWALKNKDSFC